MLKNLLTLLLCSCIPLLSQTQAAEVDKIKAMMQFEHETFLVWLAKEKGWDKELGLDIDLEVTEDAGLEIVSRFKKDHEVFNICGIGAVPTIIGCNDQSLEVVDIANDESATNMIYVREDSDILKTKGWNKDFPYVYGSPESIKGKMVFLKRMTHASYLFSKWLEMFNLDLSDVTVKSMNCSNALEAMDVGQGDIMGLWVPDAYIAEERNYKLVADLTVLKKVVPINFVADAEFAKKNPKVVAKFIAAYLKAVDYQKQHGIGMAEDFIRFSKIYSPDGVPVSKTVAEKTILNSIPYSYDEAVELFEKKNNGKSQAQLIHQDITNFFILNGILHFKISKHIKFCEYLNPEYLYQAKEYYKKLKNK